MQQAKYFPKEYLMSYHRVKTEKCEGVQPYRVNPKGTQEGVGIDHEVKMGVYKKDKDFHVVITPADFEATEKGTGKGSHLVDPSKLGLVEYTINPFNTVAALEKILEKDSKASVTLHFNDLAMLERDYVYNNNANNLYTCVTSAQDYVNAVSGVFGKLKSKFEERVKIDSENEKFNRLSDLLNQDTGQKLSFAGYQYASTGIDAASSIAYPNGIPEDTAHLETDFVYFITSSGSTSFVNNTARSPSNTKGKQVAPEQKQNQK